MKQNFDPIDFLLLALAFIGAGAMAGIITVNAFDVSLADMAFPNVGQGISLATVATAIAFAGTIITNDNAELDTLAEDVQDLDTYYYGAVVLSAAGLVGWVFIGDVSSFVQSSDLWGVAYIGVTTTAHFALGWML
jgi:hypothetical protein